MVDVLRRLEAERARELLLELGVRAVVGASNHVRDPEVVVVDHARKVIGRAAVRPEERRAPEAEGTVRIQLPRDGRGLAVPVRAFALANRAVVPCDSDPVEVGEDLLDGALDLPGAVGVVDPEQKPVAPAPVRHGGQGAAEME